MRVFWNATERRLRAVLRLVLQTLLVVFLSAVAFALLMWLFGLEGLDDVENPLVIVASNLVLIGAVLAAAPLVDRRSIADFGLRVDRAWLIDLAAGLLLATLSLLTMFVIMLSMGWVSVQFADPVSVDYLQIGAWFAAFAFVGIGEEMLARGYHLRNMAEGLKGRLLSARGAVLAAAVVSSIVFGLLHVPNPNMTAVAAFNLCVAGIVLALPVLLTGRLGFSIGFHIAWNFVLGNVLGFPVSGLALEHSMVRTRSSGPEWITGGAFGPEGGVAGLATDALAIVLIVMYVRASEGRVAIVSDWARYQPPAWRRMPAPQPVPGDMEDESANKDPMPD